VRKKKRKRKVTINFEGEGNCGIPLSSILGGGLLVVIPSKKEGEAPNPTPPPVRQKPARQKEECSRRPSRFRGYDNHYRGRR